jgi:NAD(P)-dependent dehydrogenase (short-subunit alcohol dehydrogenase family)
MLFDAKASPFRTDLFKGQRVLVTGGGTGMGRVFAEAFASLGAHVAIASRDPKHLEPAAAQIEAATGRKVAWAAVDVRRPEAVDEMMATITKALGGLDILVNNAAGNFVATAESMSPNAWRAVTEIVLNGTFFTSRAALPHLKASKGSIVNILATYAWMAAPHVAHSGAAKAGVMNLTRSLAVEWAPYGIRVNAVTPGVVPTEGAKSHLFPTPDIEKAVLATIPARRLATPQDIAHGVLFCCAPQNSYLTGANIVVDGGQWLVANPFSMMDAKAFEGRR